MDVVIVGSIAYDSLSTPSGVSDDELGGSATYGGFSSSFHGKRLSGGKIALVGVVGDDFLSSDIDKLVDAGLDIRGIETAEGGTFRWKGSYHGDMSQAQTHETHLNVFEHFQPKIPEEYRSPKVLFCANLHPALQMAVIQQSKPTRVSILDSMNLWIDIARDGLLEVIKQVDLVVLNDGEVRMLAGDDNLVRASHKVQKMTNGAILVVKRGEHGVLALHPDGLLSMPAFPVLNIVDPTGCGDTFAGALATMLAQGDGNISKEELAEGLVHATVTASFTLQTFGTEKISNLEISEYETRLEKYRSITNTS
ncbi:MAG: PfkB family carbohydrate kinase [Candidatus Poseidoniaceae archaeon]|nr:PfkB family carbohydrate kinase [Candidatus Poseidoniaceae archaeon]